MLTHGSCCLSCAAPQVAERSLFLWNNEYIVNMVAQYRSQVLPIVFGALEENAANHWNPAVHGLTCNVRRMFQVGPWRVAAGCGALCRQL
jgi:serine/threonine-protein phosphatase 2A regulatory subunit B'